jgi:hypothetical protein
MQYQKPLFFYIDSPAVHFTGGCHMPIDFSNAWNTGVKILNQAISLIPNFLLAIVVFLIFLILASAGRSLARRWVEGRK